MPSERQVEAGSGRDCEGFGFYSKGDGGGASIEAGRWVRQVKHPGEGQVAGLGGTTQP